MKLLFYVVKVIIAIIIILMVLAGSEKPITDQAWLLVLLSATWLFVITKRGVKTPKGNSSKNVGFGEKVKYSFWPLLVIAICYGFDMKLTGNESTVAMVAFSWFVLTIPLTIGRLRNIKEALHLYPDEQRMEHEKLNKADIRADVLEKMQKKNREWEASWIEKMGGNENMAILDEEDDDDEDDEYDYFFDYDPTGFNTRYSSHYSVFDDFTDHRW